MSYWGHHHHLIAQNGDNTALVSIVSVVIGFALAVGWDMWKRSRDGREALQRACRSILQESEVNFRVFKSATELLIADNNIADKTQEIVNYLDRFTLAAGESAFLSGALQDKAPEISIKLRNIYAGLAALNYRIENRELYKVTNGAMSNYHHRRKMINDEILTLLSSLEKQLREFVSEIEHLLSSKNSTPATTD